MKPDLITADTGPLIHLAAVSKLDLLSHFGTVHIPDLVVLEATFPGKPYAAEIKQWLSDGVANGFVHIPDTETGRLLHMARMTDPSYTVKDGGELAIRDWLIDTIADSDLKAMVVYENGKVPRLIQNYDAELSAAVLTTRSFFSVCEKLNLILSAESLWEELLKVAPTTNPKQSITLHGKFAEEGFQP